MVGEFKNREKAVESERQSRELYWNQGREQIDAARESNQEAEVKRIVMKELRESLREQNALTLKECSGDITGVVNSLEDGTEITKDLFNEDRMDEGMRELCAGTIKNLLSLDRLSDVLNFIEGGMNERTDADMEEYYERYSQTPEGKARIEEVRKEVGAENREK